MSDPFNPDIPGDYSEALGRVEALKCRPAPMPRYSWPNPDNERIKQLEVEIARLRQENTGLQFWFDNRTNALEQAWDRGYDCALGDSRENDESAKTGGPLTRTHNPYREEVA